MPHLALVVRDCEEALAFHVDKLGYTLIVDIPARAGQALDALPMLEAA